MKVIAVIQDPDEIKHILRHLIKIGRARPELDESSVNSTRASCRRDCQRLDRSLASL
jgi:hypothetical protein